jgi:hypothetical protein
LSIIVDRAKTTSISYSCNGRFGMPWEFKIAITALVVMICFAVWMKDIPKHRQTTDDREYAICNASGLSCIGIIILSLLVALWRLA